MDRTRFYEEVTNDGTKEFDFLANSLTGFTMQYRPGYYKVAEADLVRPDMISYKCYGSVAYWWLICFVNNLGDLFTEMAIGQQLLIPNIVDVYNFYKRYRKR